MVKQIELVLPPYSRGFHLITPHILKEIRDFPEQGLLNLFVKHTSCALAINENADPSVREDLEHIYDHLIPEADPAYRHTLEGPDDMPSHAKCIMTGVSLTIPITHGKLNLGTWQGIYLCEFRDYGGSRKIVATIMS